MTCSWCISRSTTHFDPNHGVMLPSLLSRTVRRTTWTFAVAIASAPIVALSAQVVQSPGVSLGLKYIRGQKNGIVVVPVSGERGDSITAIISRDLDFSDRFTVIPPSTVADVSETTNYPLFGKLGVDQIVQGTLLQSGWLRVVLHEVAKKSIVNSKDFPLPAASGSPSWRLALHGISDEVEMWITGQRGIAQSRIAFASEFSGGRVARVWIVDSDGANVMAITPNGMAPQWTPSGRGLVYNVVDGLQNRIMYTDLITGAQRVLSASALYDDFAPTVSPDGKTVVFSRTSPEGTDLYSMPIDGSSSPRRLTFGRGRANSQPSFSPDGQRLVFGSDRTGNNDVYISDADGTNAELLSTTTFGDRGFRSGPDWSPDGRSVAFSSLNGNTKQIMTINLRDQSVKSVATEGRNDDPSWAPDSRHLVFTSDRSLMKQIWVVDVETGRTRQLKTTFAARLAAWSPRLALPY